MKEEAIKEREERERQRVEELERERIRKIQEEEERILVKRVQDAKRLAQLDQMEKDRQRLIQVKMDEIKIDREKEKWHVVEMSVERDGQKRMPSEEEEVRVAGGEGTDLHSSASDEGVLTKDSSTEDLIEKQDQIDDGHESE